MNIPTPTARRRARIEIIPLIDIMFFLLATFVMVSLSMIKNQGIPVTLPAASSGVPQEPAAAATVTITEQGDIYLDHEAVTAESLSARLQAKHAAEPDLRVVLHGDERALFGSAIQVLDDIRLLGITKIAVQTRPQEPRR
ncbi:MAG: biopolymer transporter ExbD [Candidatus Omnitrophica bacterium]|nr:biopolymer transporter ExbD [Candidatus Omnitrophota bacterium]